MVLILRLKATGNNPKNMIYYQAIFCLPWNEINWLVLRRHGIHNFPFFLPRFGHMFLMMGIEIALLSVSI